MQENVDKGDTHKERIVYWNTNTAMVTKGFDFVPTKAKVNHDTHILLFAKIYKRIPILQYQFPQYDINISHNNDDPKV